MQALCLFPALAPWKGSLFLSGAWTPWVSLVGICSVEAELPCRQAGSCLPQPAAACWETALPTSLTSGAEWGLAKGEAEPPYLNFFCSWLQHLPSSLFAGSHFSGHNFSGIQASPAKCWLAPKPPKPGFSALSLPNGCCCPSQDGELIACYPALWKRSIFMACAKCHG